MRIALLALLGLVVGTLVGVVAFDSGPGVELIALLTAAAGLLAGGAAGLAVEHRGRRDRTRP